MSRITTYPKITEISPEDLLVISDVSTPYTSTRTVTVQDLVGGSTAPLALTTFGTSGPATLINNVLNVPIYSSGTMSSWTAGAGGEGGFEVSDGELVSFIGGTKLSSSAISGTSSITFDHNPTTRQDTTSAVSPGGDGTFTVIDSITQDSTGHTTAVNVKTVTMPTTGGGGGMTQWFVDDGGAGGFPVQNNDSVIVQPGAKIDLVTSTALKKLIWSHESTTRNDTTSAVTPGSGGTFTVVDSITQDATGHPTAINVKTVTMPTSGGGGTTYDLASAQDGANVDITLTPATGAVDTVQLTAGSGITLTDDGSNNITIDAAAGGSGLWTATGNDIYNNNSNAVVIGKTTAATDTTSALEVSGRISQVDLGNSVFIGFEAGLNDNLTLNTCVGVGYQALKSNTSGTSNIAIGSNSLLNNTTGGRNIAFGTDSLKAHISGVGNMAMGFKSLESCTNGQYNMAFGENALSVTTSGLDNIAIGRNAGRNCQGTEYNVFMGSSAGTQNTTGEKNTGIGYSSLLSIGSGSNNTAIGSLSGGYSGTPDSGNANESSNSVYIGADTVSSASGNTNEIVIGYRTIGKGSNTATIGNDSITETYLKGVVVLEGYTFATLPASPVVGMRTYITDSALPTYYTNAAGGGTYKAPVFYDGSNWLWA